MNDPNGPIYFGGRWHIYFQYSSATQQHGAVEWGHASSADLARWTYHRPAICPDPGAYDRDGCWSGNTVNADGNVIAFYSGLRREHPYQSVLAAISNDGGYSFGRPYAVVADPDPSEQMAQFRDPFVWREDDTWLMLVGAGDRSDRASARLYESSDLATWNCRGDLASLSRTITDDYDTGMMWECPQLVSFDEREALLVAAMTPGKIGKALALTGVREDGALQDPRITRVDLGPNFYAPSVLRDGPAGPLLWGWITEGRAREWAIEADWSGMLSLPRSVGVTTDGRLTNTPAPALETLRAEAVDPTPSSVRSRTAFANLGAQFEVELEFEDGLHQRAAPTQMSLRFGAEEHLDIVIDQIAGRVHIDRDDASRDPRADKGVFSLEEPTLLSSGPTRIRWFVDGSVSELFTSSGYCSTLRFYPTTPPPWQLEITGLAPTDAVRTWSLHGLDEDHPTGQADPTSLAAIRRAGRTV